MQDISVSASPTTAEAAPSEVPVATTRVRARSRRVEFIDLTRGFLFILMTSSHALSLSGVPGNHFFNSVWWLPRFWATLCFIILSGFSVAYLFDFEKDPQKVNRQLRRRGVQLLIVMFVSNIIMLLLSLATAHNFKPLADGNWWLGLLTFETNYSISAILIPTALLLFALSWLHPMWLRMGLWVALGCALALSFGESWLAWFLRREQVDNWLVERFITEGIGHFEVLHLWVYGLIGFAMGRIWREETPVMRQGLLAAGIMACVLMRYVVGQEWLQEHRFTVRALEGPIFFVTALAGVLIALRYAPVAGALGWARLIGKYALFSFLAHRIVLQALHLVYREVSPNGDNVFEYELVFPGTLLVIWLMCYWRERSQRVDRALRAMYL